MSKINTKIKRDKAEKETLDCLKDFQQATVERIVYLFQHKQNRVLVADEVGLGKTLIARGVIVKMTRLKRRERKGSFKVVYVCSNQNIANQNVRKLDIADTAAIEKTADTRLSMQHLKIAEQEEKLRGKEREVQIIPLTPETSFRMTRGRGSVQERALMFAILKRMPEFQRYPIGLEHFMMFDANRAWDGVKQHMEIRVQECERNSEGCYLSNLMKKIRQDEHFDEIKKMLLHHLQERRYQKTLTCSDHFVTNKLRLMFARVSVSMLQPDLVIMDEFQRFSFLLSSDESELGILSHRFFHHSNTKVLLLSATPYQLYSTLEEIDENQQDEHFEEFYRVMDFLFEDKKEEFHRIWAKYSAALRELKSVDMAFLEIKKQAEDALYRGVCRTERISVMESGDYTDDSSVKKPLSVREGDILSYIQLGKLTADMGLRKRPPEDYVKSCPYLLSFMQNYQLKRQIEQYGRENPEQINQANQPFLWLNRREIDQYKELPKTNARLEALKETAFLTGAEFYLWVPPSKPYYPLQGVYKNSREFSKVLVFSSWKMVPRMIGAMISYEAERRTVGKLSRQAENQDKKTAHYFAKSRYPASRLNFHMVNGEARGMSLFCLLYPSKTLSELYDPIYFLNQKSSLKQIERELRRVLEEKLDQIEKRHGLPFSQKTDKRWYYLAPMIMDGIDFVQHWIHAVTNAVLSDDQECALEEEKGKEGFFAHIEQLEGYLDDLENVCLDKRPEDLLDTLIDMVLGSPAVCIYRSNGNQADRAAELARVFVSQFNLTESTAIIDLVYGRCKDVDSHWKNVLKYSKDGCFSSMFDEYLHMAKESVGFSSEEDLSAAVHDMMMDSFGLHTVTYAIDTFEALKQRTGKEAVKQNGAKRIKKTINLRSNYAVGFTKESADNTKIVNRKESIRNAFNSPLRPFVLATTSIGQEGLDFHFYCRKIMHWNLPGNPVDLEQREGRINRFKCLTVRQNVANRYGRISFTSDIWKEMFTAAEAQKEKTQSDLVPYWCFGRDQTVKIERIVPMYPVSRDEVKYHRLIQILSLYRLTLGQAKQEELLDYLFLQFDDASSLKELFINLSPFAKETETKSFPIFIGDGTFTVNKKVKQGMYKLRKLNHTIPVTKKR